MKFKTEIKFTFFAILFIIAGIFITIAFLLHPILGIIITGLALVIIAVTYQFG